MSICKQIPEIKTFSQKSSNQYLKLFLVAQHTFVKFGNLGNPFNVVSPTLIKLSDSRLLNASVRPVICVARQLSRFNSLIYNIKNTLYDYSRQK